MEWIKIKEKKPSIDDECLFFIKQYRSDSGHLWHHHIVRGFFSNEMIDDESGFYAHNFYVRHLGKKSNKLDGTAQYEFLSDCKYIEITHWMPIPEHPKGEENEQT